MKRKVLVGLGLIVLLSYFTYEYLKPPVVVKPWHEYQFIAHAMGGVNNEDYTNSLEAFKENYEKGIRVFEIDLLTSCDGELILLHDWKEYNENSLKQPAREYQCSTKEEFLKSKIHGKYTSLSFDDVIKLSKKYKDVYFIFDTKTFDLESSKVSYDKITHQINNLKADMNRFIPQAYTFEMYQMLKNEYPFESIILTLYHIIYESDGTKIAEFSRDNEVKYITLHQNDTWAERVLSDLKDFNGYWELGLKFYIHTINDPEVLKSLLDKGVSGVYTDYLH